MPERERPRESIDEGKEGILRLQLKRIRLMFRAEEDAKKIRKVWLGVEVGGVMDEALLREVRDIQARVDDLPAEPAPAEDTA
jgi:hypothetical protein